MVLTQSMPLEQSMLLTQSMVLPLIAIDGSHATHATDASARHRTSRVSSASG
jgi:hypothetical protein